jgi:hypothetical protein
MNSSMAGQCFVKAKVESSNLSSSAFINRRVDREGMWWLAKLLLSVKRYEGSIPSLSASFAEALA